MGWLAGWLAECWARQVVKTAAWWMEEEVLHCLGVGDQRSAEANPPRLMSFDSHGTV